MRLVSDGDERAIALARRRPAHLAERGRRPGCGPGGSPIVRVDQAGRADHLLGEDAAGALQLPFARRRRDMDGLRAHRVPFLEAQRPVVHAGRQAEAILGQRRLAPEVAAIHAADLRHGDMALVGEDEGVVGQVLEQGRRRLAGLAAGQPARVVLDAGAGAGRLEHLQVEGACAAPAAAPRAGGPAV